ncbi:MAG TPA: hypothetical protein VKR42_03805 [Ktedonobacteraceae bacterium]|nr:hypothetical protein [Ktedonobacteraceae bacterium]
MKSLQKTLAPGLFTIALMSLLLFTSAGVAHAVARQSSCGKSWTLVPSPNPGTQNVFDGIAAISQNDVWAVGYSDNQPLTAHWDGTSWSAVSNPTLPGQNSLLAVTAIATNDVWAVGESGTQVLVEQWNGTSWSTVTAPTPGVSGMFTSVAAIPGTSNVWAIGHYQNSNGKDQTLIEQWDGTNWNVVSSPNVAGKGNDLLGVTAVSASDAWVVGTHANTGGNFQTLIEQWNGTSWNVVHSPNVDSNGVLWSVTQIPGSQKVLAAGTYTTGGNVGRNLVEQWDKTNWQVIPSQDIGGINNTLFGTTAVSSTDAWAVGLLYPNSGPNQALTEHWNGKKWTTYYTPNVQGNSILTGVTNVSSTNTVWAVGVSYDNSGNSSTIAEEICL